MNTERLRLLAASYRLRAEGSANDFTRAYEADMADYLEKAAAFIEATLRLEPPNPPLSPGKAAPASKP